MKPFKSHKQAARSLKKLITNPGMPEEVKQGLVALAEDHEKAAKVYTSKDVFSESYK